MILKRGLKPPATLRMWAVIRLTEGRRWIDTETLSGSAIDARRLAQVMDAKIPTWAKDNPIVDVKYVRLTEE